MADTDYEGAIYSAVADLLAASSDVFAGPPLPVLKNFIRYDADASGYPERLSTFQPRDLPRLTLDVAEAADDGYGGNPRLVTFGRCESQPVNARLVLALTLIHADLYLPPATRLRRAVLKTLFAAGPRIGLAYVYAWGPVTLRTRIETSDRTGGTLRRVTDLALPVHYQLTAGDFKQ